MAQIVKNPPALWKIQVRFLGLEDPLEKGVITHCSILVWRIPWTEEPGKLQSMWLQRVRYDWATNTYTHTHKENWISQVNEFSTFLCLGRCKRLKSSLWYAPQLSGASTLFSPWIPSGLTVEGVCRGLMAATLFVYWCCRHIFHSYTYDPEPGKPWALGREADCKLHEEQESGPFISLLALDSTEPVTEDEHTMTAEQMR